MYPSQENRTRRGRWPSELDGVKMPRCQLVCIGKDGDRSVSPHCALASTKINNDNTVYSILV
jgi:hypothetical protein